jgi:hypothetical protein
MTAIPGLSGVTKVRAGRYHTFFILDDGMVKGAGDNERDQLGQFTDILLLPGSTPGTTDHTRHITTQSRKYTPLVDLPALAGVQDIATGAQHSVFLWADGTVKAAGSNSDLALGVALPLPEGLLSSYSCIVYILVCVGGFMEGCMRSERLRHFPLAGIPGWTGGASHSAPSAVGALVVPALPAGTHVGAITAGFMDCCYNGRNWAQSLFLVDPS